MGLSLRDQLLQAGLVSQKQIDQQQKSQRDHRREQKHDPAKKAAADARRAEAERAAQAAEAARRARDAEANRARQEKLEQKARRAEARQLIEQNRLPRQDACEELYNFLIGERIKRIPADAARRAQLASGALRIVRCEGRFEVVPAEIAARVAERDPHAVIPRSEAPAVSTAPATDDPYAKHVVPDDLMW